MSLGVMYACNATSNRSHEINMLYTLHVLMYYRGHWVRYMLTYVLCMPHVLCVGVRYVMYAVVCAACAVCARRLVACVVRDECNVLHAPYADVSAVVLTREAGSLLYMDCVIEINTVHFQMVNKIIVLLNTYSGTPVWALC